MAIGPLAGAGGLQHLTRCMGRGRAMEALLSGDDQDAGLAERYGGINRALPENQPSPFVDRLAGRLAGFPFAVLRATKRPATCWIVIAITQRCRRRRHSSGVSGLRPLRRIICGGAL